jgi:hypothetical protein
MGKFEDMSERLAETERAARTWKRRALGAEARVAALEAAALAGAPLRVRCESTAMANGGRVQCSRASGRDGPHRDAWAALFWVNHAGA